MTPYKGRDLSMLLEWVVTGVVLVLEPAPTIHRYILYMIWIWRMYGSQGLREGQGQLRFLKGSALTPGCKARMNIYWSSFPKFQTPSVPLENEPIFISRCSRMPWSIVRFILEDTIGGDNLGLRSLGLCGLWDLRCQLLTVPTLTLPSIKATRTCCTWNTSLSSWTPRASTAKSYEGSCVSCLLVPKELSWTIWCCH